MSIFKLIILISSISFLTLDMKVCKESSIDFVNLAASDQLKLSNGDINLGLLTLGIISSISLANSLSTLYIPLYIALSLYLSLAISLSICIVYTSS